MKHLITTFPSRTAALVLICLSATAFAGDPQAPVDPGIHAPPLIVACVGDSITAHGNPHGYPAQLGYMLGDKWTVENYGVSGTTLMTHANNPYQKYPMFQAALASKADVVVIMLGTNDTKAANWGKKEYFIADYKDLIDKFKAMATKPRIFIMKAPFICARNRVTMSDAAVLEQIPMIDQIAKDENVGVLDAHAPTAGQDSLFGDGVHPTPTGAALIAKAVDQALTGTTYDGPIPNFGSPKTVFSPSPAQIGQPAAFSLSLGDVLVSELFLYRGAGGTSGFVKINYTKEKGAEYSEIIAANPGKKISVILNGKALPDTAVTDPPVGQSIDVKIAAPNEGYRMVTALVNPPAKPGPALEKTPGAPVLSLMPADVHKVVVALYKDHTELEVTYAKDKQEEFTKLTSTGLPGKFEIVLNGSLAAENTVTRPMTGHSLKVEMPSPREAFAMALALISPEAKRD